MKLPFLPLRNWAETDEAGDAELSNIILPVSPEEALRRLEAVVSALPRWRVEETDAGTGQVYLTRRTFLFHFVDDIHLRLEAVPDGTRLRGRSQSRLGRTDLGQNRRNLRQLITALRRL